MPVCLGTLNQHLFIFNDLAFVVELSLSVIVLDHDNDLHSDVITFYLKPDVHMPLKQGWHTGVLNML